MPTSQFHLFAAAVAARFAAMSEHELYRVDIDGDTLWQSYLAAFPEGTNPIFRVRTEHDGSYDRNFIRQLGNVVNVTEHGSVLSLWDIAGLPEPYNTVAAHLAAVVRSAAVNGLFRTKEPKYGYVRTIEKRDGLPSIEWFHFHADIPKKFQVKSVGEVCGAADTDVQVAKRSLEELKPEAVETVLDLIEQGALYRGDEFKNMLLAFKAGQQEYRKLGVIRSITHVEEAQSKFLWVNYKNGALRIRNTAIGTLLVDLSEGMDLETAVKRFETKVAPANYKRPTALITPKMIEKAVADIRSLGLEPALARRHATLADVSINNVLWADNQAQSHMKDGLTDMLMGTVKTAAPNPAAVDIDVQEFVTNILPKASSMDVYFDNRLRTNLMSITAPVHADAGRLFKWDNGFAWSYNGNIADSEMRRAVEAKGGRVDGAFRFSHQWNYNKRNASLMDLHVFMPGHDGRRGSGHGGYGNRERVGWNNRQHLASGGVQDVDYVQPAPVGYVPVENITFPDISRMPEGEYRCAIQNWSFRAPTEGGFKAEIEFDGQVFEYEYDKVVKSSEWVDVAVVTLRGGQFTIEHKLPHSASSQDIWGLTTQRFVRVETLLNSPNHWDGQQTGNKHWFFILEGCKNPEPCRGLYNEFLRSDLEQHRKVFEVLGGKTKVEPADSQLSGLGFSSTKRDSVIVRVTSNNSIKTYKVNF